ncbi:MAG TPA: helix-turn-helix transcriptional regulator [Solirubrobacteraceae bacterium]|jgi:transcriptional regulator with XRE-family HTH domain|nr:helix-turn-helix transcriptional regulator [Solirubrobacteraceae bacterium]HTB49387.1 helix-turn-helix transcriptional regulator [Solirubrobacteraceae bacterium]
MNSSVPDEMAEFGQRLRELRTTLGISQDDLSRRTGIHSTAIGRLERGKREPRLRTILRVAKGLGIRPGALLDGPSPDLSVGAMLARHGERELTSEEFERHFGHLPTDGEG